MEGRALTDFVPSDSLSSSASKHCWHYREATLSTSAFLKSGDGLCAAVPTAHVKRRGHVRVPESCRTRW
ncbi:hypothetical protein VFPFJ_02123 [Purpureocillium lilacinum]|uniref:Uncharacterized protein n=1 Tax=Purpureocillium lilacinum TaxID=33203 RepID=A0A179HSW9_PURLI|nr:hypothetical protein VFPFJ_02123 [Purpureocillium lilacinum]OAQ79283.1 hypothetical protein VFPBJ_07404 [Purpureocillium lilacinum]OAQ92962.1 hypothetical protein VFPFJ_02123 [Purpureocillium lilacinum]